MESPTPDYALVGEEGLASRTMSMTHRLLAGSGTPSLVAYHLDPMISVDSLAHGLTRHGELVVAGCLGEDDPIAEAPDDWPIEVRLDILKESPEPAVHIVAAAAHMLGSMEWVPDAVTAELLERGELPDRVAAIASSPNGRLASITTTRVLLHDSLGVTPVAFSDISARHMSGQAGDEENSAFPPLDAELDVFETVACIGPDDLTALFFSVINHQTPGLVMTRRPLVATCQHVAGKVFCVDVDRTGVVLMRAAPEETVTVYIPLAKQATTLDEFGLLFASITQGLTPSRQPRI
ncbi:hypothetical protein GCM10009785_15370 [Brooklawnia cerclae]|uniref:DUF2470 domain-containing protein n=1 Tax=Brooklawnia cerclae TaxID=349934 RepID=A0ABX0SMA5_9ACTN|nr:hypothetical protein [Brooklawnia cerclae]NIH57891.1 hypothetical protein [Brooklawnia cerclae]